MSEENKIKKIQTPKKDEKNTSAFFTDMVSHSSMIKKNFHDKFFHEDLDN